MAEKEKKKIPDYARVDVVGIYYSQMKIWQVVAVVLAVATAFLSFKVSKSKYVYLYSDQLQVVKLSPTSPKVEAFLNQAAKAILRISYQTFDRDVKAATAYMTPQTGEKFLSAMSLLKSDFLQNKYIWTPESPQITVTRLNKRIAFVVQCPVIVTSVETGKEAVKNVKIEGFITAGTPNEINLYPYRISDIRLTIPP